MSFKYSDGEVTQLISVEPPSGSIGIRGICLEKCEMGDVVDVFIGANTTVRRAEIKDN